MKVKDEFITWATGYSGCDGNLDGSIWFCGIEYGGDENKSNFEFSNVSIPTHITDDKVDDFLSYQYNIKIAKLYSSILGNDVKKYREIAKENKIFDKDSNLFKMNLYPISFHHDSDDSWQKWICSKTGLHSKSRYREWCQLYRFKKIREWVKKHSPKLIVATSKTYKNEFIMAFDSIETVKTTNEKNVSDRQLVWIEMNKSKTILVITPFLGGRYGLNSDKLLGDFGKEIRNICVNKFGEAWTSLQVRS